MRDLLDLERIFEFSAGTGKEGTRQTSATGPGAGAEPVTEQKTGKLTEGHIDRSYPTADGDL